MGFWKRLLGREKVQKVTGIDISSLESDLNKKFDADLKQNNNPDEIESNLESIIDAFSSNLEDSLVAKLADDWTCGICETKNHKTEECSNCGHEPGTWKCPKCGNAVTGDDEYGPLEKACDCGFDSADE